MKHEYQANLTQALLHFMYLLAFAEQSAYVYPSNKSIKGKAPTQTPNRLFRIKSQMGVGTHVTPAKAN